MKVRTHFLLHRIRIEHNSKLPDIYSITLTAVSSLLRKYKIDTRTIGRLEVGTETLLDKSKSVKSVLMQLFSDVNTNIVGVDNINACYGGTNALFNAVDWIESSAWDGRDAIVVAGDVAVYSHGAARPTGGAGAAAILVGPNAPVVIQPGLRGSFFQHAYDFYKADLRSEYPIVQGQYSMECYTRSLDACYEAYKLREQVVASALSNGSTASNDSSESVAIDGSDKAQVNKPKKESADMVTDRFDYMVFHSPTTKLVTKSFARLLYDDFKAQPDHPLFKEIDPSILDVDYEDSLRDKKIDKIFSTFSAETYDQCVKPSNLAAKMCGNMYTASLYSGLVSLLSDVAPEDLFGKTVGMFSYGSGLASTLFSLKVVGDTSEMRSNLDLSHRLDTRRVVAPEVYEEVSGVCLQCSRGLTNVASCRRYICVRTLILRTTSPQVGTLAIWLKVHTI